MFKNWKFKFKNLGPIKDATLELGDLTIITGRNNTGKTYMVYTLYGFLRDFNELADGILEGWSSSGTFSSVIDYPAQDMVDQVLKNETFDLEISKDALNRERIHLIKEMSGRYSYTGIDDVFNSRAGTFPNAIFDVEVDQNKNEYSSIKLDTQSGEISIIFLNDKLSFFIDRKKETSTRREWDALIQEYLLERDLRKAYVQFLLQDEQALNRRPHCSTSARLAVSLFYPELETSRRITIRRLQQKTETIEDKSGRLWVPADIINESSSRYALPINDEIDFTKTIPNFSLELDSSDTNDAMREIEKMMGGSFVKIDDALYFISSKDSPNEFRIPLHVASSSAVEISNLYFYFALRREGQDQLLIIDEPESHMDPINQIKLARALVRWVKSGVKILISTHSDFIVKEINNLIMLDRHFDDKEQLLKELNYSEEDSIHPSAINAYHAVDGGLEPCSMNEFGIEVPSFEQSIDELIRVSSTLGSKIILENRGNE